MEIQDLIARISVENLLPESETKNNNTIDESYSITKVKSVARLDPKKSNWKLML